MIVAAHPDDEVLGCGGTIARHTAEGAEVHVLFLADGVSARGAGRAPEEEISARQDAARRAAKVLGAETPRFTGLPDNRLDGLDLLDIVKAVEEVVAELRPAIVYTHHGGDLNVDHALVHRAVVTACRPLPESPVRALYAFETVSSTEWSSPEMGEAFRPNHFVDIGETLAHKLEALECYAQEIRPFPHARSREGVEALARLRGCSVGLEAAEAFLVVREIAAGKQS